MTKPLPYGLQKQDKSIFTLIRKPLGRGLAIKCKLVSNMNDFIIILTSCAVENKIKKLIIINEKSYA
jgi:hypothetical protein